MKKLTHFEMTEAARLFFRLADLPYVHMSSSDRAMLHYLCFHGPVTLGDLKKAPIEIANPTQPVERLKLKGLIVRVHDGYQLTDLGYRTLALHHACLAAFERAAEVATLYLQAALGDLNEVFFVPPKEKEDP